MCPVVAYSATRIGIGMSYTIPWNYFQEVLPVSLFATSMQREAHVNDSYFAEYLTNGAMPQRRIDLSMRAILVRECGMTEHSWKRFLVRIVNACKRTETRSLVRE
jgi:hypothetical protein